PGIQVCQGSEINAPARDISLISASVPSTMSVDAFAPRRYSSTTRAAESRIGSPLDFDAMPSRRPYVLLKPSESRFVSWPTSRNPGAHESESSSSDRDAATSAVIGSLSLGVPDDGLATAAPPHAETSIQSASSPPT